ncbi:sugar transferase [Egicoccus sp. AB-alg2]|uniref:sugar transferase n=1 Tax=Egicoccus sp. AB-alg2 TaxID=3242693 RepID=UPI00359DFB87
MKNQPVSVGSLEINSRGESVTGSAEVRRNSKQASVGSRAVPDVAAATPLSQSSARAAAFEAPSLPDRRKRGLLGEAVLRRLISTPTSDAVALAVTLFPFRGSTVTVGYVTCAWLVLFVGEPGHRRLSPRVSEDGGWLVKRLALTLVVFGPWAVLRLQAGRLMLVFVEATVLVVAARAVTYAGLRRLHTRGLLLSNTLVVGTGVVGQELGHVLRDHPEYGLRLVGYVDGDPPAHVANQVVASPEELSRALRELAVRRVVVAFGARRASQMVAILRACDAHDVTVYHVPRFFELGALPDALEHDDVWGIPLVRHRRAALRPHARVVKRAVDLLLSAAALLVAAAPMAVLAALVHASSPGPILFRQVRIGQSGREFEMLKFRTMYVNDDSAITWSVAGDPRLTPVGAFLRKSSLDELPQLFNVLRGDMSLVGPRPERPHFVYKFGSGIPGYTDRHRVPVGVTGWAQIHGLRGDTSIEQRVRFDNYYIENWSLWLDFVILFRTLRSFRTGG